MSTSTLGERLDRALLKRGFNRWPLTSLSLIQARRALWNPGDYIKSYSGAAGISEKSSRKDFIPKSTGYVSFGPNEFDGLDGIVSSCLEIYARHEAELATLQVNKLYFFNILTEEDLRAHPNLIDFALSREVTEAATAYLGQVPRLHSLGVFYSAVNKTTAGSQLYHIDGDCLAQVKCFINAWDVNKESGAFTFMPKDVTTRTLRTKGLLKQLSDEALYKIVPQAKEIVVEGVPGSGVFCDTSRCLHQGSRARVNPRLIFQFQFVCRPDSLPERHGKSVPGGHLHVTRELVSKFSLTNPHAMSFVR